MIREFKLPDLGEGLTESEIVAWRVAEGDAVELNQVLAEVETAKAVVELPSPYAGTVKQLHGGPGTVVQVGSPIVTIELPGTAAPDPSGADAPGDGGASGGREVPEEGADGEGLRRTPTLVGYGAAADSTARPTRRARHGLGEPGSVAGSVRDVNVDDYRTAERPRSTPPVRKLAHDLGIDLASVRGTGPAGLVLRDDVMQASANGGPLESETAGAGSARSGVARNDPDPASRPVRETRTPIRGVRRHTAAAMVESAFTAPHVTEFLTVDVTAMMELIERLRAQRLFAGVRLTPLAVVARAVCLALARNPTLNSRWDAEHDEIIQFHYVNLGIAVAAPRGLLVPNIKDAQDHDLQTLAAALATLAATAREGKTGPEDLSGGTISITNVGVFGIDAGTPILNPGEAAILAMGAVRRMPWEYRGGIELRSVMTLSLSFDHRLVDGEQGSRFLADVGAVLADPGMALVLG